MLQALISQQAAKCITIGVSIDHVRVALLSLDSCQIRDFSLVGRAWPSRNRTGISNLWNQCP